MLSYLDVLKARQSVGHKVAIIGAGGIGFDTAEFLTHEGESGSIHPKKFYDEWGIDTSYSQVGGLKLRRLSIVHVKYICYSVKPVRSEQHWAKPRAGFIVQV